MKRVSSLMAVVVGAAGLAAGCGGDGGSMTGPSAMGVGAPGAAFLAVTPQGGAAGVSVSGSIVLRFGGATGCAPQGPLSPRTTYAFHVGGGMVAQSGQPLDYAQYGPTMGGQWIMGGMMGASHGGDPWGMMGSGWRNANGSYGMVFSFTTA